MKRRVIVLGGCAVALAAVGISRLRTPTLGDFGRPVLRIPSDTGYMGGIGFTDDSRAIALIFYPTRGELWDIDLETGESRLRSNVPKEARSISPNGRWLLIHNHAHVQRQTKVIDVRTMKKVAELPVRMFEYHICWRSDSRAFLKADTPNRFEECRIDGGCKGVWLPKKGAYTLPVSFAENGTLIANSYNLSLRSSSNYHEGVFTNNIYRPGSWQAIPNPVPARANTFYSGKLSPRGDRVLWSVTIRETLHPWIRWALNNLGPPVRSESQQIEVWVSDRDGGARTLIARSRDSSNLRWSGIWWLPDGRRFVYQYDHQLYVASVP